MSGYVSFPLTIPEMTQKMVSPIVQLLFGAGRANCHWLTHISSASSIVQGEDVVAHGVVGRYGAVMVR